MEMESKEDFVRILYEKGDINIDCIEFFGYMKSQTALFFLPDHTHEDVMEICFIIKGNQQFSVNNTEYEVNTNTAFITLGNEIHSTGSSPLQKNEFYWIGINLSNIKNFRQFPKELSKILFEGLKSITTHKIKFESEHALLVKKTFDSLTSVDITMKKAIFAYLPCLLFELISLGNNYADKVSYQISNVIEYIHKNIEDKLPLETLADISGYSLSHFKYKFKTETGNTPTNYVLKQKIVLAKKLLEDKESTITDIAYRLNFSSSSYFSLVFKQFTTLTPTEYIKLHE